MSEQEEGLQTIYTSVHTPHLLAIASCIGVCPHLQKQRDSAWQVMYALISSDELFKFLKKKLVYVTALQHLLR